MEPALCQLYRHTFVSYFFCTDSVPCATRNRNSVSYIICVAFCVSVTDKE